MIITCPNCEQDLEIQEEWVGLEGECPSCSQSFLIADTSPTAASTELPDASSTVSGTAVSANEPPQTDDPLPPATAPQSLTPDQITSFKAEVKALAKQYHRGKHDTDFVVLSVISFFVFLWNLPPFFAGELAAQYRTMRRRTARKLRSILDALGTLSDGDKKKIKRIARKKLGVKIVDSAAGQPSTPPIWLVFNRSDAKMPDVCAITGQPAERVGSIHLFQWQGVVAAGGIGAIWKFFHFAIKVPFSNAGWHQYRRKKPLFFSILENGLVVSAYIPLLPVDVVWLLLACLFGVWILGLEHLLGRENLCYTVWTPIADKSHADLCHLKVRDRKFAAAFVQLNPESRIFEDDYTWRDIVFGGEIERFGHCRACGKDGTIKRKCPHVLLMIIGVTVLTLVTFGLALIPIIIRARKKKGTWHCVECGSFDIDDPMEKRILPIWARIDRGIRRT